MNAYRWAVLAFLLPVPPVVSAGHGFNATWVAKGDEPVGFWISAGEGTCESLKEPFLAVGTKNTKAGTSTGRLAPKDLDFCLLFIGADKSANCTGGTVEAVYDAGQSAYRGKYQLSFKNGQKHSGEFFARHCERRK